MGKNLIRNVGYSKDILDAVKKSHLDSELGRCLKIDGSNPAWDDLNMAGNRILDLKDVDSDTPASTAVIKIC